MFTTRVITQVKNFQDKASSKLKGTVLERWLMYWKTIGNDYKQVVSDLGEDVRNKPVKSAAVITGLGFLAYSAANNPDATSFRDKYIRCTNEVALVSPSLVRESTTKHLKYLESCYNAEILRYKSFGLFSVIWTDTSCEHCDNYANKCSYLQWKYLDFPDRIVDVGFLNIWWKISREMLDFDVNYI